MSAAARNSARILERAISELSLKWKNLVARLFSLTTRFV